MAPFLDRFEMVEKMMKKFLSINFGFEKYFVNFSTISNLTKSGTIRTVLSWRFRICVVFIGLRSKNWRKIEKTDFSRSRSPSRRVFLRWRGQKIFSPKSNYSLASLVQLDERNRMVLLSVDLERKNFLVSPPKERPSRG